MGRTFRDNKEEGKGTEFLRGRFLGGDFEEKGKGGNLMFERDELLIQCG